MPRWEETVKIEGRVVGERSWEMVVVAETSKGKKNPGEWGRTA